MDDNPDPPVTNKRKPEESPDGQVPYIDRYKCLNKTYIIIILLFLESQEEVQINRGFI